MTRPTAVPAEAATDDSCPAFDQVRCRMQEKIIGQDKLIDRLLIFIRPTDNQYSQPALLLFTESENCQTNLQTETLYYRSASRRAQAQRSRPGASSSR
jgi:hypothetical protein